MAAETIKKKYILENIKKPLFINTNVPEYIKIIPKRTKDKNLDKG
jgi:hypothetical protein